MPREIAFWSAIAGAIVGGSISAFVQSLTRRDARRQRDEDRKRTQQAQAYSLLFKLVRIHSNFHRIHRHIEFCFAKLKEHGGVEPWPVMMPLINLPDRENFTSDEMGMLLGLKEDDTFNATVELDVLHNSLIVAMKGLDTERRALTARLQVESFEGAKLAGTLSEQARLALRPAMIAVNSLAEAVRNQAARDSKQSRETLVSVLALFERKLDIKHNLEFLHDPNSA